MSWMMIKMLNWVFLNWQKTLVNIIYYIEAMLSVFKIKTNKRRI